METQQQHGSSGGGGNSVSGKVKLEVSTTAGFYPSEGFDEVPVNQKVQVQLEKAARQLRITNTAGWVATVVETSGKRVIVVTDSYAENHLAGEVTIDWGPSEGGGGSDASRGV